MQVHVLGPLTVTGTGPDGVPVSTPNARKHRELLALLALEPGRTVRAETLADGLWRGSPPPSAATTLQGYVRRVRTALGAAAVRSDAAGYGLAVDVVDVDAALAAREIGDARARLAAGDPGTALPLLTTALARWRGPALAEIADLEVAVPVVARLDELRLEAEHALASVRLALGRDHEAVPRLRALVAAHPLREAFVEPLARALHRVGRRAEALEVLRTLRTALREELGVDPSAAITGLEAELLRDEAPPAPAPGLHGRDDELATLRRAWAGEEPLSTIVVTGEPGIGKTTLVDAFAATIGARVRRARATGAEEAPPFWLWRRVLGADPATAGDHRWAVGLRVAEGLRALAADARLLVVLDDLQWADPDSLAVLETVLDDLGDRGCRVTIVGICRAAARRPEVTAALAALARRPGVRIALQGLAPEAVAALAADRGARPGAAAVVVDRAGGNPFLAGELAGLAGGADPAVSLPVAVRDVVLARADRLPSTARTVLEVAAVLGAELDPALLAHVVGDAVDPALAALAEEGLLVAAPAPQFRHDLVRDAVLDALPPGRRAAVHGLVADALERLDPRAAPAIAVHRSAAAGGTTDDAAAGACLRAAREVLAGGGDEEAVALARRGLDHAAPGPCREDLCRVLGEALLRAGRMEDADAALGEEAASARARGDVARLADVALVAAPASVGGYWTGVGRHLLGTGAALAEALAHVDHLDAVRSCGLAAAEAVRRSAVGEPGALGFAVEARRHADLVTGADGPPCVARAEIARFVAGWSPATIGARLDRAETLAGLVAGDPDLAPTAVHLLRTAQLEAVRFGASRRTSRRFAELAAARPGPDLGMAQAEWESMLDLLRGDHEAARVRIERLAAGLDRLAPAAATVLRMTVTTIAGITAWHEGRLVEMVGEAEAIAADADEDYRLVTALGLAQGGRGHEAVALAAGLLAGAEAWEGPRSTIRTAMLVETLATVPGTCPAAASDAREHLDRLTVAVEGWEDGMVVLWPGTVCLGPTMLYRGTVRAALGRPGATADLRRAAELAESVGARPSLARARARLR